MMKDAMKKRTEINDYQKEQELIRMIASVESEDDLLDDYYKNYIKQENKNGRSKGELNNNQ